MLTAGFICLAVSLIIPLVGELIHRSDPTGYRNWISGKIWLFIVMLGPALAGVALWKGSTLVRLMGIIVFVLQMPLFLRGASWLLWR